MLYLAISLVVFVCVAEEIISSDGANLLRVSFDYGNMVNLLSLYEKLFVVLGFKSFGFDAFLIPDRQSKHGGFIRKRNVIGIGSAFGFLNLTANLRPIQEGS